jgi:rSAM/selenodomain-associated transferase 1
MMAVINTRSAKRPDAKGSFARMKAIHRIIDPCEPDRSFNGLCALAVMTKAPRAGQVKTRLVPPLTPAEAADLNRCFLRDTASALTRACGELACGVAVYTPRGAESDYTEILPSEFLLLEQRSGLFGERLIGAAEDLFRVGFASVCLIDSDSPTVPADWYAQAATVLSRHDDRVVLGPSEDGGYYLIGLKNLHPRLFEDIDWSTPRVLEQTIARANELRLLVELLPTGYDVDDRLTLRRLRDELLGSDANSFAPDTREFLSRVIAQRKL